MDVELQDMEVQELIKQIEGELEQVDTALDPATLIRTLEQRLKQLNNKIKTMGIEIRSLRGTEESKTYKPKVKEYEKQAKEFEKNLKWAKARSQHDNQDKERAIDDEVENIRTNEDAAIRYGHNLLNETEMVANQALQTVTHTVGLAADTAQQVHEQTEQIRRIDNELEETYGELERAERVIKRIARRTLTDKYLWCLAGLILIAIIAVIVLLAVQQNGGSVQKTVQNNVNIAHPLHDILWKKVVEHTKKTAQDAHSDGNARRLLLRLLR